MNEVLNFLVSLLMLLNFGKTPEVAETKVMLLGDVMLGRSVMTLSLKNNNPSYPFEKVGQEISEADIVFANLENPVISDCPPSNSGFKFCSDPKMIQGLSFAGVDIVNLSNNHTLNYGNDGLTQTKNYLNDNSIKWVGHDKFEVIEKNGTRFGFLGFDLVTRDISQKDIDLIRSSKESVDILIVGVHWGQEYKDHPNKFQKEVAKKITDNGADVISGHHPHWIQDVEWVNDKPVFYSLGNFVFDQMWSEKTKKGMVGLLTYSGASLRAIDKLYVYMEEFAQPKWVSE